MRVLGFRAKGGWIGLAAALAVGLAQSPVAAQERKPVGSWQELKKNTQGSFKRVGDKVDKFYKDSPNLQLTVEGLQTAISTVVDAGSGEALPPGIGDLATILNNSPELVKRGLDDWLNNKILDAINSGDRTREARYDAFRSCLRGDCAALNALLHPPPPPPGLHTGQPERVQIAPITIFPAQIAEGETVRITVSLKSVVGGEIVLKLDAPGETLDKVECRWPRVAPGATRSCEFNRLFPAAGTYKIMAHARDARSDDSTAATLVVTKKAPPPPQASAGNSGRLTGEGLELIWNVSGADVGERFFAERTWQAKGTVTGPSVRFWGVLRASVPPRLTTDSGMQAYISGPMGAGKKEMKWNGALGAPSPASHEMPFDLTFDATSGQPVAVAASVNKVGGVADLLAVNFQFAPRK